jgi:hypothetical protein
MSGRSTPVLSGGFGPQILSIIDRFISFRVRDAMGKLAVLALRVVLAIAPASLVVQGVMVPLLWADLDEAPSAVRVPVVVIVVLGILTMQVTAVCVWRLHAPKVKLLSPYGDWWGSATVMPSARSTRVSRS